MASEYALAREVLELERAEVVLHKALTKLKGHFTPEDREFYDMVRRRGLPISVSHVNCPEAKGG